MTILLRIAERVLNRPLLVHPDKLPLIMAVLQGRIPISGDDIAQLRAEADLRIAELPDSAQTALRGPLPEASRFEGDFYVTDGAGKVVSSLPYRRTKSGVANIPVIGSLINRGYSAEAGSMSKASYEGLKSLIAHASADDNTKAVLLDIHSPGGEAIGAFELAAAVRALAAKKPVTAVVNGMAASAAYAIAASARRIITTSTGVSGSIGVVMMHADFSRALDKAGVTPTLIFAGAHKVDGHPFAPLADDVREDLQREVDVFYDQFVQTVAAGRKGLSSAAIRGTEARTYIGADAVDIGLADEVGTFEAALTDLSTSAGFKSSPTSSPKKGLTMSTPEGGAGAETISKADHEAAIATVRSGAKTESDAAVAAAKAAAKSEGLAEGAVAERTRILGIESIAVAGHDALIATLKADGKTSPEQAAMRILEAEKTTRGNQLRAIKDVETEGAKVPAAPTAGGGEQAPKASTPEQWKAEYANSEALQAEFTSAESYAAYMAAEKAGKVKRLINRSA